MRTTVWVTLLVAAFLAGNAAAQTWGSSNGKAGRGKDAVNLQDVNALTFYDGRMTTGKRSRPVPQLTCVGGAGCGRTPVDVVQCKNVGYDGVDVQWKCEAQIDNDYRLGKTTVNCEGYSNPDDAYVLAGSCGLEYTLEYSKKGKSGYKSFGSNNYYNDQQASFGEGLANLVWIGIIGLIIYGIWSTLRDSPTRYDGGQRWFGSSWFGGRNRTYPTVASTATEDGFWGGLATGGLLGWMFSGWGRPRYGYYDTPAYAYPGSTGWGWGRSMYRPGFGSGGGATYASSSGTHTSAGYGGTRRR